MNSTICAGILMLASLVGMTGCSDDKSSAEDKVGTACVPSWEMCPQDPGAREEGVRFDIDNPMCNGGTCISNHFRGRVTCPMGNPAGASLFQGTEQHCVVPGTSESVVAAVVPQCSDRKNNVYCTCQCAGSDTSKSYCSCPSGFVCGRPTEPIDTSILAPGDKYCVRPGNDSTQDGTTCCSVADMACSDRCDTGDLCGYKDNSPEIASQVPSTLRCEASIP